MWGLFIRENFSDDCLRLFSLRCISIFCPVCGTIFNILKLHEWLCGGIICLLFMFLFIYLKFFLLTFNLCIFFLLLIQVNLLCSLIIFQSIFLTNSQLKCYITRFPVIMIIGLLTTFYCIIFSRNILCCLGITFKQNL
uniref:Uncharacterized protein n=1 Tax=Arundo donax TaxID=35708 RepID=A0A0A9DDC8_ARUDO